MVMTIEEISAHLEIRQALARYCRGVDRRDAAMLKSVYHADGIDDHTVFRGLGTEFADFIIKLLNTSPTCSQHQITSVLISLKGPDAADVESYYLCHQAVVDEATGEETFLFNGGRYLDRFEQRGGEWKIASRLVTIDWSRKHLPGEPWEGMYAFPKVGGVGVDPSYSFLSL